jgi:hypothetical protein
MKTIQGFLTKTLFVGTLIIGIITSSSLAQAQVVGGAPSADAGPDQTITLPTNSVTVSGTSSGINGFVIYYSWTSLSGTGNIVSPSSATTDITGLTAGTHTFRFTATNNTGDTAWDDVNIIVNPAGGPGGSVATVNAGPDQVIYYPTDQTNLVGSSSGINGIILYYTWTRLSGTSTITSPNTSSTTVSSLSLGDNNFRLTVTNNTGTTAYDDVMVTVLQSPPPFNIPPTAYAGSDQTIYTPNSTAYLVGNGNDPDGSIVSYTWSKISGSGTINGITGSGTGDAVTITGLTLGESVFRLTVMDNQGDTGSDDMTIRVSSSGGTGGGGTGGGGTGGGSGGGGGIYVCPVGTTGIYPNCVINTTNTNPIYFVNTANLNMRASASVLSAKVGRVKIRTHLEVLEGNRSSTWVKVRTNTGLTGYVMTRYTQQLVKVGNRASITVRLVNVRSDESLRFRPLRTLKPTDVVDIIYVSPITSWVKIKSADGRTGFVNKYLLKVVQ